MGPWSLGDLDDNGVIEEARRIYRRFQVVNRWSEENDSLLRRWGAVCLEMHNRGITDTVTEGGHGGDAVELVRKLD